MAAVTGSRLALWAWLPRIATRALGADPGSVRTARDFTVTTRHQRGMAERSPDIAIVVPELMTNALRHACPGPAIPGHGSRSGSACSSPGPASCAQADDPGKTAPAPRTLGSLDETGRGLHLIRALSDQWGCTTPSQTGKVVRALFARGRHRQPRPGTRADQAATGRRTWQPGRTSQCERSVAGRVPHGHRALACDLIHRSRVDNYLVPIRSRPPS